VRDSYRKDETMLFVTTDRQSAFDRVLASVPFKGQVLNLTSAWWFDQTRHIIPNHLISVPDPNTIIAKKADVFPIEFVVRGYITGSTSTSLWTQYNSGVRTYCGITFPEGLVKNQKLDAPVLTPTTKEEHHDRPIAPDEIVSEGWMSKEDWQQASEFALQLFGFGQKTALEHGLILVDTKYEMGKDKEGNIMLIDEIHTPDSSRYWLADSYQRRLEQGLEPKNIDKEFLRLWFKDHCDPYNDEVLPAAPDELVIELSQRYIQLFEMITGEAFKFPNASELKEDAASRLERNLKDYLQEG
jgi:phosphoribosylaminoimidazole-succinocarboxamide synthase